MKCWLPVVFVATGLSGCAMATRGTDDKVAFQSIPIGAAVATSSGHSCRQTPCTIEIPRKTAFSATFSKNGYQPQTVEVESKIGKEGTLAIAGDVLPPGGLAIAAADLISGAVFDHAPNPVVAKLNSMGKGRKAKGNRAEKAGAPNS